MVSGQFKTKFVTNGSLTCAVNFYRTEESDSHTSYDFKFSDATTWLTNIVSKSFLVFI